MLRQLRQRAGVDAEDFVWRLRWRGHEIIRARVAKYGIDCDLQSGHLHAALTAAHMLELQAALAQAQRRGLQDDVTLLDAAGVRQHLATDRYVGALKNLRNFHLHPLNLCIGEAAAAAGLGALLFEHSAVTDIVHGPRPTVVTAEGRVSARQVLLAGDVYHRLERRRLSGLIFPAMGGIVATRPLGALSRELNPHHLAVYDCRFVLDYYRPTADGRLLFGGGANYSGRESRDVAAELRPAIELTFPQLRGVAIDFQWTCAMGIVINRIPQLGRLSDTVWYCQGYSGHGIATSHIMGEILAEALTGTLARFDTFASFRHIRVPFGDLLGNPLLAAGMWYTDCANGCADAAQSGRFSTERLGAQRQHRTGELRRVRHDVGDALAHQGAVDAHRCRYLGAAAVIHQAIQFHQPYERPPLGRAFRVLRFLRQDFVQGANGTLGGRQLRHARARIVRQPAIDTHVGAAGGQGRDQALGRGDVGEEVRFKGRAQRVGGTVQDAHRSIHGRGAQRGDDAQRCAEPCNEVVAQLRRLRVGAHIALQGGQPSCGRVRRGERGELLRLRDTATTRYPAASSCRTTRPPTCPVAPSTHTGPAGASVADAPCTAAMAAAAAPRAMNCRRETG